MSGQDARSAATVEQLELVPTPRCDFCGHLAWTVERFGRLTHKCACPHRTDSFCQAHPQVCDNFTDIRNEAWRKSYQISELPGSSFEEIFDRAS